MIDVGALEKLEHSSVTSSPTITMTVSEPETAEMQPETITDTVHECIDSQQCSKNFNVLTEAAEK